MKSNLSWIRDTYAGNQCYPKCSLEKFKNCEQKINEMLKLEVFLTIKHYVYMLNGKLCVDLIKPFFIFKENQDLVNVPFETIENPEYAMVGASNGDFEHWFLKWSG